MKKSKDQKGAVSPHVLGVLAFICTLPILLFADPPQWWASRGVTSGTTLSGTADYAAANQGQLKNIATQAAAEFDADLPGGAGEPLHDMIGLWTSGSTSPDDYAVLNLGQLKMVAKPFYDRLIGLGYATQYPWTGSPNPANDYAVANIGQVKNLFSFNPAQFPQITNPVVQTVYEGSTFNESITATNTPTSYSATGLPPGLTLNGTTGAISGIATVTGTYNVTLNAINSSGTGNEMIVLNVVAGSGTAPVITSATTAVATVGSAFAYQITGSFNPTSFRATGSGGGSLPSSLTLDPVGGLISGTVTASGTYGINLNASNGAGTGMAVLTLIANNATIAGGAPVLTSGTTASGTAGESFTYTITATSSVSGTISYSASGLPAGLGVNASTGVVSGTMPASGTYSAIIGASNGSGTTSAVLQMSFAAPSAVITSSGTANGMVGVNFVYQITANNNPVGYSYSGTLPPGLSLNPASGVIYGTGTLSGTYSGTIAALNPSGTATAGLVIDMATSNPVIISGTVDVATAGVPYFYNISTLNSSGSYTASGLPPGLELDPATGDIMGTPTMLGTWTVNLGAVASGTVYSGTATSVLYLTVGNNGPAVPTITSPWIMYSFAGATFSGTVTAVNSPTGFFATGLPSGLSIDGSTGAISGTVSTPGSYYVSLTASNSVGTATSQLICDIESTTSTVSATVALQAGVSPFASYQTSSATILDDTGNPTVANSIQDGIAIGNFADSQIDRGLVGFDLSMLPPDATPTSASLSLNMTSGSSTSQVQLYQGATLFYPEAATWSANSGTGSLLSCATVSGAGTQVWNSGSNFTSAVQNCLTCGIPLQLMLVDGTAEADVGGATYFYTASDETDSTASNRPLLTINYTTASPPVIVPVQIQATGYDLRIQVPILHSPTSISGSNLPPGMTLDGSTGIISGGVESSSTYQVNITAVNDNGTGSGVVTIVTGSTPDIPGADTTGTLTASSGSSGFNYSYTIATGNGPATFSYSTETTLPEGLTLNPQTGVISGTTQFNGVWYTWLNAQNVFGSTGFGLQICFNLGTPQFSSGTLPAISGNMSVPFQFNLSGSTLVSNSPTGFTMTSGSVPGLSIQSGTLLSGTPTTTGTYAVTITGSNGTGTSGSATLPVIILPTPVPVISATAIYGNDNMPIDGILLQVTTGSIGCASTYSYALSSTMAAGLSMDSSGSISGTPDPSGTFQPVITATDSLGGTYDQTPLTIDILSSPTKGAVPTQSVVGTVGSPFRYQAMFFDGLVSGSDEDWFALKVGGTVPPGLNLSWDGTGVLSGTPTAAGTYAVVVIAGDGWVGSTGTINVIINGTNSPIIFPNNMNYTWGQGLGINYPFNFQIPNFISGSAVPTVSSAGGLPAGLVYQDNGNGMTTAAGGGTISGIPTQSGTFNVTLTATNSTGTSNANLLLTVEPSQSMTEAVGTAASGTFDAGDTTAFDFMATNLPPGLSLDPVTGVVSGTAVAVDLASVTVNFTNQNGFNTSQLLITINSRTSDHSGTFRQGMSPSAGYLTPSTTIVSGSGADTASGTVSTLFVGRLSSNAVSRGLLAFDVSSLPPNANITGASLLMTVSTGTSSELPMQVEVHQATNPFDQATATWNNNNSFDTTPLSFLIMNPGTAAGTATFHGTVAFAQAVSQVLNNGSGVIYLSVQESPVAESGTVSGTDVIGFTTGTSDPAHDPQLIVTYTTGTQTEAPVITSPSVTTGTINSPFSYAITASNLPTSYSTGTGTPLPSGLTLNGTSGVVSGTGTVVGSTQVLVCATNAVGTGSSTVTFNIDSGTQATGMVAISGTNQFGVSGALAPAQLVAEPTVSGSIPLKNTLVTFTAKPGAFLGTGTAGPFYPVVSVPTGTANGYASVYLLMPQTTGTTYVTASAGIASVVFPETTVASLSGTSGLSGTSVLGDDVPVLSIVSGEGQSVQAGQPLLNPFVVQATNHLGQPVSFLPLGFAVTSGSGSVSASGSSTGSSSLTLSTDSNGLATIYLTTGTAGAMNQVACTGTSALGVTSTIYLTALTQSGSSGTASPGGVDGNIVPDSDPPQLKPPALVSVEEADVATSGTSIDPANQDPSKVLVTWVPSGTTPVNGYIIYEQVSGGPWNESGTASGTATSFPVSGLVADRNYEFSVATISGSYLSAPAQSNLYSFPIVRVMYWQGSALQLVNSKSWFSPFCNPVEFIPAMLGGTNASVPITVYGALSRLGPRIYGYSGTSSPPPVPPPFDSQQIWQPVAGFLIDSPTAPAVLKGKYQFLLNPSASGTLNWYEVYYPSGTDNISVIAKQYGGVSAVGTEDTSMDEVDSGTGGYYSIVADDGMTVTNGALGVPFVEPNYGPDLDPVEKSGSGATIFATGTAFDDPAPVSFSNYSFLGVDNPNFSYYISLTSGTLSGTATGFGVIDTFGPSQVVFSGSTTLPTGHSQVLSGSINPNHGFEVFASGTAPIGVPVTLTLYIYQNDPNGSGPPIITTSSNFVYQPSSTYDYSLPVDEASGPKYRKIAMNGMPLSDEKPQHSDETDQEKEETFVDALTIGLRHSTTDVYLPVAGSDFTVSARRDFRSEVWNLRHGLRPHEEPDHPFGICWSSNLAPNIHFVQSTNPNQTQPDTAVVTDEAGTVHAFVIWYQNNDHTSTPQFFPMPTAKNEQAPNLESLVENPNTNPVTYTFKKKYGSTLTFQQTSLNLSVAEDRGAGSQYLSVNTYARLTQAVDRLGDTTNYNFVGTSNLVPATIMAANQPDTKISIKQNSNGIITAIWDARGNETTFGYSSFIDGSYASGTSGGYTTTSGSMLTSVTAPDGSVTNYTYDEPANDPGGSDESDQTPRSPGTPTLTYYHADLKSITDPLGHKYCFDYNIDTTKLNYMANPQLYTGYYVQSGLPRTVSKITMPDNTYATFNNLSKIWIQFDSSGNPQAEGQRQLQVTDASGFPRTYRFEDPLVVPLPQLAKFYQANQFTDSKIICYQSMSIDYGSKTANNYMGTETFQFDISAAMALEKIIDFSGNPTTFTHTDAWSQAANYGPYMLVTGTQTVNGLFGNNIIYNGFYPDPDTQVDALSGTETFAYDNGAPIPPGATPARIMTDVTDQLNRHTHYTVDNLERRTNETVYTSGSSNPVKVTSFAYGSTQFPGFVTQKTIQPISGAGDPSWVQPLVTQYVPDPNTGGVAQEIVDPGGLDLVTSYTYDADGNKLTATDPRGDTTWFSYDSRNRLTNVVYADGSHKSFTYDARGNKTKETDENGNSTLYQYDSLNRLVEKARDMNGDGTIDAGDIITQYAYNAVNSGTWVEDPDGNVTTMGYDAMQRMTSKTDPLGNVTHLVYGTNSGGNAFDLSSFKPTQSTDPRGIVTNVTYDALYRPTVKSVAYSTGAPPAATSTIYDAVGNAIKVYDPLGHQTITTYDALNRPTVVTHPDGSFATAFYTSTGFKYRVQDELWNASSPDVHASDMVYDNAGRETQAIASQVVVATGSSARPVTYTFYDAAGNVSATINPLLQEWDYSYDARNRKIQEFDPPVTDTVSGSTLRPVITMKYDLAGNATGIIDARSYETDKVYDAANRVTDVNEPMVSGSMPNIHTTYDAAGNVLTVRDPDLHTTTNTYDAMNRLLVTSQPVISGGVTSGTMVVSYSYDPVGNKILVNDGNGNITLFEYDGLNRNTSVTDPLGCTTQYVYDGVNKTQRVDAKRQTTTYLYDVRNRLVTVSYASAATTINSVRNYSYDAVGNMTSVSEPGKGGAADVAYCYDGLNRVIKETSSGLQHQYSYDLGNNRVKTVYGGSGRTIVSAYDALNRLSTMTESGINTTSYGYDLNGNWTTKTLPNGDVETGTYDALNRMTNQAVSASGSALYTYGYSYDQAGNMTQVKQVYLTGTLTSGTVTNTYDSINRLTNEADTASGTTAYTYDAGNNRLTKSFNGVATGTYAYNAVNELTAVTGTENETFTYDADGNRTTRVLGSGTDTYSYDFENRLVGFVKETGTTGTGTYAYAYDYRTRRVTRDESAASGTATTVSFSGGTSVEELTGTATSVEYIRGSDYGGGVGGVLYTLRSGTTGYSFTHENRRGDVVAKTNGSGSLTYQAAYQAFGTQTQTSGSTLDRQKANTKDEDPTGLLNEGMRYTDLDGGLRVFLTKDPAGFVDGPNLYTYVRQNPWTSFDPEGLLDKDGNMTPEEKAAIDQEIKDEPKTLAEAAGRVFKGWGRGIMNFFKGFGSLIDEERGYDPADHESAAQAVFTLYNSITNSNPATNPEALGNDVAIVGASSVGIGLGEFGSFQTSTFDIKTGVVDNSASLTKATTDAQVQDSSPTTVEKTVNGTDQQANTNTKGSANPAVKAAAIRGSKLHSDKPGNLPDQLRSKFLETEFKFTLSGQAGQDVEVVDGMHPSAYPFSDWPKGVNFGDFKPATPGGLKTFNSDQLNKWSQPTYMLPYDPDTGLLNK